MTDNKCYFCLSSENLVYSTKYQVHICNGKPKDSDMTCLALFIKCFSRYEQLQRYGKVICCDYCQETTDLNALRVKKDGLGAKLECRKCWLASGKGKALRDSARSWEPVVGPNSVSNHVLRPPRIVSEISKEEIEERIKTLKSLQPISKHIPVELEQLLVEEPSANNRIGKLTNFVIEEEGYGKMLAKMKRVEVNHAVWLSDYSFRWKAGGTSGQNLTLGCRVVVRTPDGDKYNGSVVRKVPKTKNITIHLGKPCNNQSSRLEIEVRFTDIPYRRQQAALDSASKLPSLFLDILAGHIHRIDERYENEISTLAFKKGILSQLCESQKEAVRYAIDHKFSVIQGPPGCGKSTCIACQALTEAYSGEVVAIITRDNAAADNLTGILLNQLQETPAKKITMMRVVGETYIDVVPESVLSVCSHITDDYDPDAPSKRWRSTKAKKKEAERIGTANIVIATSCMSGSNELFKKCGATSIIMDEANMLVDAEFLIPLTTFSKSVEKVSLYGDQNQIGPFAGSPQTRDFGYGISLIERIATITSSTSDHTRIWPRVPYEIQMLNTQFRMHPNLALFPSEEFYKGKLRSGVTAKDRRSEITNPVWPNPAIPRIFYNVTNSRQQRTLTGKSVYNVPETCCLAELLEKLYKSKVAAARISVITFYSGQVELVDEALPALCGVPDDWLQEIEVNTVDAYEGRDIDYVILLCCRSLTSAGDHAIGFLDNPGRMNVALTRSKYGLYVIGHAPTLASDAHWSHFINHCDETHTLVDWSH